MIVVRQPSAVSILSYRYRTWTGVVQIQIQDEDEVAGTLVACTERARVIFVLILGHLHVHVPPFLLLSFSRYRRHPVSGGHRSHQRLQTVGVSVLVGVEDS